MTRTPEPIKFELADTTVVNAWGVTLHQIRATEDIPCHGVRKGDLGGYVSSTHLPSGAARVFDNAWVFGAAQVSGAAQVFGDAWVSGAAQVSGDARVSETWHYLVVGPIGSEGAYSTLTRTKGGVHRLSVGCWEDGSLGTLMAEVKRRRRDLWTADEATQELWMQQYRALRRLGRAVVARWTEAAS